MTLIELRDLFRREVDDLDAPALWSDEEIYEFANDAQNEACRRARLLIDSSTVAICQITVAALASTAPLDSRIIFVRRARITGKNTPLDRASWRDLDESFPGWESHTGTVSHFVSDWETGKLRLYRIPTVQTVLNLTVARLPLADMGTDDSPEINVRYHRSLVFWMKYRAYMKQDAETANPEKAKANLELFEQEFGRKSSAIDEEWIDRQQQTDTYDGTY